MFFWSDMRTVLVHFDAGVDVRRADVDRGRKGVSDGTLARMRWYLEWTAETGRCVHVLVPGDLNSQGDDLSRFLSIGQIVRYYDEGDLGFALPRRRGFAFIVNGNQFPVIHWRWALGSAHRYHADVLVFGPSRGLAGAADPESVLVDSDGQVLRFKRHYADSPGFADRWTGDAAFLMVKADHALAVAAHMVVRGWGLDSIGALVRRFAVRWFDDALLPLEDRQAIEGLVEWTEASSMRPLPTQSLGANGRNAHPVRPAATRFHPSSWTGLADRCADEQPSDFARPSDMDRDDGHLGRKQRNGLQTLPEAALRVRNDRAYRIAKRAIDILASALGLLLLSPLFLLVAALIKLTSRGPVFYAHTRQGLGGREFPCLKFRSMRTGAHAIQADLRKLNEVDGPQFKITRDPRVTRLGCWLRRSNIDELPQLMNVLAGQMSLVGPRPSPDQENQYCPAWRCARLSTRPGITGLWQVLRKRQASASDFQEWIYYDVEYARHQSLWLDLQILLYTPISMIAPRHVTRLAARLERAGICTHVDQIAYPAGRKPTRMSPAAG